MKSKNLPQLSSGFPKQAKENWGFAPYKFHSVGGNCGDLHALCGGHALSLRSKTMTTHYEMQ